MHFIIFKIFYFVIDKLKKFKISLYGFGLQFRLFSREYLGQPAPRVSGSLCYSISSVRGNCVILAGTQMKETWTPFNSFPRNAIATMRFYHVLYSTMILSVGSRLHKIIKKLVRSQGTEIMHDASTQNRFSLQNLHYRALQQECRMRPLRASMIFEQSRQKFIVFLELTSSSVWIIILYILLSHSPSWQYAARLSCVNAPDITFHTSNFKPHSFSSFSRSVTYRWR